MELLLSSTGQFLTASGHIDMPDRNAICAAIFFVAQANTSCNVSIVIAAVAMLLHGLILCHKRVCYTISCLLLILCFNVLGTKRGPKDRVQHIKKALNVTAASLGRQYVHSS